MPRATICGCRRGEDACLFCSFAESDDYALKKHKGQMYCLRCYKIGTRTFFIHTRCTAVLKQYCPLVFKGGKVSFRDLCRAAISARPLVRSEGEASNLFTAKLQKLFICPFGKLPPEIVKEIYSYLDQFPELVSLTYAISAVAQYAMFPKPSWTETNSLRIGMILYLTFSKYEGRDYLAGIHTNPPPRWRKSIPLRDQLLIRRDHFAILNLYGTRKEAETDGVASQSTFYHTIDLRNAGTNEVKFQVFSDGRFLRMLVSKRTLSDVMEWNTLSLPGPNTYWLFERPPSGFTRYEYHDMRDISGLTGAVLGSRTIGLFCHRPLSETAFKSFTSGLKRKYPESNLIFLYFPLHQGEKIHAVAVRRIPGVRFPTNHPVIQVSSRIPIRICH